MSRWYFAVVSYKASKIEQLEMNFIKYTYFKYFSNLKCIDLLLCPPEIKSKCFHELGSNIFAVQLKQYK